VIGVDSAASAALGVTGITVDVVLDLGRHRGHAYTSYDRAAVHPPRASLVPMTKAVRYRPPAAGCRRPPRSTRGFLETVGETATCRAKSRSRGAATRWHAVCTVERSRRS
jgi:hypothetical protein